MDEKVVTNTDFYLALNEPAPDFTAVTTQGKFSLSEMEGKWVVLFSHPADFTPVCTTEFVEFAKLNDAFLKMNVHLVGLSIDSVFSHIAWVRNIEEKFGVKIPFPVIADLDMKVARMYGMIHHKASSTSTVRCVFIIDPKRILRAMVYYPMSNGRNIPEIMRLVKALQTSDQNSVATPANWQPGDDVIVPPPGTQQNAEIRVTEGYECKDWYFCKKPLKEKVTV
jgi:peroxiredoxin (alkyl hydroperoxide reductase subunit C)